MVRAPSPRRVQPCPALPRAAAPSDFPSHAAAQLLCSFSAPLASWYPTDPAHVVPYTTILGAFMLQSHSIKYAKYQLSMTSSYISFIRWGFWFCRYSGKGATTVASNDEGYKNTYFLHKDNYVFCMNKLYELTIKVF